MQYGGAPILQFNQGRSDGPPEVDFVDELADDVKLIENAVNVKLFYYGPRTWMVGEVEPLKKLQGPSTRLEIISRIISEYPTVNLSSQTEFYRVRKNPVVSNDIAQYDSPPAHFAGSGRLESVDLPILYGSQDLQVCLHECRVTAEDDIFLATLMITKELKMLDLTEVLIEENMTEFESLDMAVHMLFLAGNHSYEISRQISIEAVKAGFDGIIYPSYFSLLRTGFVPFETSYGISHRIVPRMAKWEKQKMIPNLALFGRPILQGKLLVQSINRVIISRVNYEMHFGPAKC
ncbi:MAG: RES family NAD+ phosphorylase [Geminicoccaceae bacterium]